MEVSREDGFALLSPVDFEEHFCYQNLGDFYDLAQQETKTWEGQND